MQRALVIANPIAGQGKAGRVLRRLERGLLDHGIAVTLALTGGPDDARHRAGEAAEHDVVVVVGGDGTVNEVLNGLEADRPLAVYPLGTGNVLAKELRLPRRIGRFCAMVSAGRHTELDVARAGERRFLSMAGAGFDAAVAARIASARRGAIRMRSYFVPILKCFATFRYPRMRVDVDGHQVAEARGFVLVSNVRAYGGPLVIAPDAVHDDGLLDVCVLPRGSRLAYLRAAFAFFIGAGRWLSGARYFRGREVRVAADEPVPYQVDGDLAGALPATIGLAGHRQRLLVP